MRRLTSRSRPLLIGGATLAAIVAVFSLEPIPQDLAYHAFADRRPFLGLPNAADVLSNLPFLLVGLAGLRQLARRRLHVDRGLRPAIALFFLGVALTAFGSGYYHLAPDNLTLVWDRLPMSLAFMALTALIVGEYIDVRLGRRLLWPLVGAGGGAVLWWAWTEQAGSGDLRAYILVQFGPLLILPLVFLTYRSRWSRAGGYALVAGCYLLAKVCEHYDARLFALTGAVSGHSLKHLAAAAAAACLLWMLRTRSPQV